MTNATPTPSNTPSGGVMRRSRKSMLTMGVAGLVMLAVGAVAGAGAARAIWRGEPQPMLPPAAISSLKEDAVVAIKGNVAEIYGNKFIIADASGRALVETGREGEGGKLVAKDETITVQGRFDDGFLRGSMIVHGDGHTDLLGPAGGPPPHGPKGWLPRP